MKAKPKSLPKPEAVKAIERISDLADAFAGAAPEKQRALSKFFQRKLKPKRIKPAKAG